MTTTEAGDGVLRGGGSVPVGGRAGGLAAARVLGGDRAAERARRPAVADQLDAGAADRRLPVVRHLLGLLAVGEGEKREGAPARAQRQAVRPHRGGAARRLPQGGAALVGAARPP